MPEVVIIGYGPAGIASALYTKRAGLDALVIGKDNGSLEKAGKIENYYGFPEPVAGTQLIKNGIAQAKGLGVSVEEGEVIGIEYGERFIVKTQSADYEADAVILATGSSRKAPKIKGLQEFEGAGVSYCAVCDAFFYKNKHVAVLGNGDYALGEAKELMHVVSSVTLITNGLEPQTKIPEEIRMITAPVDAFTGTDGVLSAVQFKDGSHIDVSGVFVAIGVASSGDLAKKLGAETKGTQVVVDENMQTNVPGLFAAGDCTGGMYQISKAVYDGVKAGTQAIKFIRKKKEESKNV